MDIKEMTNEQYIEKITEMCKIINLNRPLSYLYLVTRDILEETRGKDYVAPWQSIGTTPAEETVSKSRIDVANDIYDSMCNLHSAVSALCCIRISLRGNEDFTPTTQTVESAMFALETMIEKSLGEIETALDSSEVS